jgi:hypothetical protein
LRLSTVLLPAKLRDTTEIHHGKQVLGAMIDFAGEELLPSLRLLSLGDVTGNL